MVWQDVFVGTVAIGIGLFALASAAFNWDWSYQLWKARWVEARFGRRGARIFYAILGTVMIALGLALAGGFGPNRARAGAGESGSPLAAAWGGRCATDDWTLQTSGVFETRWSRRLPKSFSARGDLPSDFVRRISKFAG